MKNTNKPRNTPLKTFLGQFFRPYVKQIVGAGVALLTTATVTLAIGQAIKWLINAGFGEGGSINQFNEAIGLFLVLVVLLALGTYARYYLVSWLGERISADIAKKLFSHVIQFNPFFYETHTSGEIQSRILNDTTVLQTVISTTISSALRNVLLLVGGIILLVLSNLKLTLLVVSFIPIVIIPILFYGRKVKQLSAVNQTKISQVGSYLNETISHIKTVQAYNHQFQDSERFNTLIENAFQSAQARIKKRAWLVTLVIVLIFGAIAAMMWVGGYDVATGQISSGELAAFIFYAIIVAGSLGSLSEVYGELARAGGALERLVALWNEKEAILLTTSFEKHPLSSKPTLSLQKVCFSYPSNPSKLILDNVSFDVRPGEKIALVGPTGAGKSTIFDLLLRFYEISTGSIFFDAQAIQLIHPIDLRDCFSLVSQDPQLFSATVLENIAYGSPHATIEQIKAAAYAANAHEFITELPHLYETHLGNQGVRLSGGQKQRIVIARALLRNPKILLLDEATSALDAESEKAVHLALERLMIDRTTLVIAHRLSTVLNADKIVVLDKGKVIAVGDHDTLLTSCALYANLAKLQFTLTHSMPSESTI